MMIDYGVGKPLQQIGAAHDAYEAAVAEHRDALDVMALQQFGDFIERGVFVHGDHVPGHHRASSAAMCLFVVNRLAGGDGLEPPRTPRSRAVRRLGAKEVSLADNAHDLPRGVDDRHRADPVL